jgi:hypothetical protein
VKCLLDIECLLSGSLEVRNITLALAPEQHTQTRPQEGTARVNIERASLSSSLLSSMSLVLLPVLRLAGGDLTTRAEIGLVTEDDEREGRRIARGGMDEELIYRGGRQSRSRGTRPSDETRGIE